jgi:hypothetical protein
VVFSLWPSLPDSSNPTTGSFNGSFNLALGDRPTVRGEPVFEYCAPLPLLKSSTAQAPSHAEKFSLALIWSRRVQETLVHVPAQLLRQPITKFHRQLG